ncbi:MAG: SpoIIE family protein phosphatase [Desulfomonilaceae bacterium]|nr:SpoIIE family protein phosphatase [Desulfomonilaceae bacterium]
MIGEIRDALDRLLHGEVPSPIVPAAGDDDDMAQLCRVTNSLIEAFADAHDFVTALGQGNLDVHVPPRNLLISPYKQLHSNLRHLTWQTQQVAKGDLSQRVDFLGEFSEAFNSMIDSLKEKKRAEHALKEANSKIMASMRYARTIQLSFLPDTEEMGAELGDFFFIWNPKDIVSGDLFFFRSLNDGFLISVMDCTGHGVPGGMMTMIAGSSLSRVLQDVGHDDPALVLHELNNLMRRSLNQQSPEAKSNDGLDLGLCRVDQAKGLLTFAGAGIRLYYSLHGEIHEMKGDKQSIGYRSSDPEYRFTNHSIRLDPSMRFYMNTDGITDQIGGPKGLSFGRRAFTRLLREIHEEPMSRQKSILEQEIAEYRGKEVQLDDMTVVGFVV